MSPPLARPLMLSALFLLSSTATAASVAPAVEVGSFVLHKFARAIGEETYTLSTTPDGLALHSEFRFKDRGTEVPLTTDFTAADAVSPLTLKSEGRSSRASPRMDSFALDPKSRRVTVVRAGKRTDIPAADNTFLVDGYAPVAMQQMLLRYWLAKGKPAHIAVPPDGDVQIQPAGDLTVEAGGKAVTLHGYVVTGLIWGNETAWLDDHQRLAAVVTADAEFDHFEAVRDGYEATLPIFIRQAAVNNLDALTRLSASATRSAPKQLVVTHVTLIDGTGAAPRHDMSVYVKDGRITRIEPAGMTIRPEAGQDVLDGTGKFLIPGLWDMHAHYEQVEWGPIYLASGVTTARDCGNELDYITTVRDAIDAGRGIGPHLLVAGLVDGTGPATLGAITADTPEQARAVVRRYKAAGAVQIKIYGSVKPALVPVIAEEAHKLGLTVTGHVPAGMTTAQAVEAGFDAVNHIVYPARDLLHMERGKPLPPLDFTSPDARRQLALFKQHHTVFDDTIALFELFARPTDEPLHAIEPGIDHVARPLAPLLSAVGAPPEAAPKAAENFRYQLATLRELHRQGLTLVAGTDQAIPGYSLHRELEIYVQAGLTPMEALQAATSVPARVMGLDDQVGTLQVGKRADMVLLDGDPLADVHNTRRIAKTIAAGRVYAPAPLWAAVGFVP